MATILDITQNIMQSITQMQAWELVAVVLSIAYLLFALKESQWCWYCAFFSTIIYTILFWEVNLFMDSVLQVYYLAMAIYGWWQWRSHSSNPSSTHGRTKNTDSNNTLVITRWSAKQHLTTISLVLLATFVSGYLLQQHTKAAWPYLDSFTTWASVITTYMVTKKVLENWLYWIVIDSVACALYIERGLYFTALLFIAYVIIVVFGYFSWRKTMELNGYATA